MKKEPKKMLQIVSIILSVAALILFVISIVDGFKTNGILAAGLGCAALGSLITTISITKDKKK